MLNHIYRQSFVLVRQRKDKTNTREDNVRLPNKPKTSQKDNLYKGQDNSGRVRQSIHSAGQLRLSWLWNCLGSHTNFSVGQSVSSCRHPLTFGKTKNCLGSDVHWQTVRQNSLSCCCSVGQIVLPCWKYNQTVRQSICHGSLNYSARQS